MRENRRGCVCVYGSGLRDHAKRTHGWMPFVVGEFVPVVFQLCFPDDGSTSGVTGDEERVE